MAKLNLRSRDCVVGAVVAICIGSSGAVAGNAAAPAASPDRVQQSVYNASVRAFGDRFGCVNATGPARLTLFVTARKDLKRAKAIAKAKGKGLVSVAFLPNALGEGALLKLQNRIITSVGTQNPDVLVQWVPTDPQTSCGVVAITLGDKAPAWVQSAIQEAQRTASAAATTLTTVPSDSIPLKSDDIG